MPQGADPGKLQWQIYPYARDVVEGMPPVLVREAADGVLVIVDGVTRATRIAKLSPGTLIRVEVTGTIKRPRATGTKVGDTLP